MTSLNFRKQFVFVALLIGFALLWYPQSTSAAPVLIDDFSAGSQTHLLNCCASTESSFAAAGLGSERDIETTLTGGSSGIQYVAASPATTSFQHLQTDTITGFTTVVWDGADSSTAVDPTGLGGVDFTGGGSNTGLLVHINSASGSINLVFTAYTDAANISTATLPLTTTVSNQSLAIPFTDFTVQAGAGADFANIGAFAMEIDGSTPGPLQISLDSLTLTGADYGDLPAAYNITTESDNGARHDIDDLYLGATVDGETDGQESANADGDDINGDDEDGVSPVGTWVEGVNGGTLEVISSGMGCLSGWIDWDNDLDFIDTGDDVIVMTEVAAGINTISFDVPVGTSGTAFYSRFRLVPDTGTTPDCSDDTAVGLTGRVSNGEVEDHLLMPLFVGLSINDVSVDEMAGSTTFTVTLDSPATIDVTVEYMTQDGTATAPNDYLAASGTLTITAGSTSTTVSVSIIDDLFDEVNETFTVNLSNAVNAAIVDGQGVGTILDDDIAPTANDDSYTTDEEVALTVLSPGVLGNDIDPGIGITFTAVLDTNPANGAVSLNSDGSFVYTPTLNFFGNDTFTYHANDGINNSNVATVLIDVLPVNDAPIAVDDEVTTSENTQAIINVLGNDIDVDITDIFTVTAVTQPSNGTTTINPDNTVTYSPTLNFNGVDVFTYIVSDGILDDTAVVTVTVSPVNTIPQVTVAIVSPPALEGTPVQFMGTVVDPDGLRQQSIRNGGMIEWDFGDGLGDSGTLTPTHTYNNNGTYTVTLTVTDGQGGVGIGTLILDVENVAPIVNAGPDQSVPENTTVAFSGNYNDPGLFDSQTIAWDFGDGTGDVDTLTPNHTYTTPGVYTVILTVTDNDGGVGTDQLIVSVGQGAKLYLPMITNGNAVSAPDLVIQSVSITADNATIVIQNTGNIAVADGFWVDLYVNPSPPPTAANQTWDQLSDEGVVWGITQISSLGPGGTLTIDLNHSSLNTDLTNFSGAFTDGMEIYVQVDSADIARQTGGVLEIHEITNGAYNNIAHVTAAIGQ